MEWHESYLSIIFTSKAGGYPRKYSRPLQSTNAHTHAHTRRLQAILRHKLLNYNIKSHKDFTLPWSFLIMLCSKVSSQWINSFALRISIFPHVSCNPLTSISSPEFSCTTADRERKGPGTLSVLEFRSRQ